jgi:glycosyltransferase involved in cell wall biosynthesis
MRVLIITQKRYTPPWNEGIINIIRRLSHFLSEQKDELAIVCAGREKDLLIGEYGEKILPILSHKNRQFWGRVGLWFYLAKHVRKIVEDYQPDVALVFVSASLFLVPRTIILKYLLGSRLVLYVSGLGRPSWGVNWFSKDIKMFVGSPFLLRYFPNATIAYPVIPVHLAQEQPILNKKEKNEPFSILYLGTTQKERGIEYLLKGFAIACQQTQQSLKLVLALNGVGRLNRNEVEQLVKDLDLDNNVSVAGIVDTNIVYNSTDVVVIPRQKPIRMSFPVRILEALTFGKPVIVTSICEMGKLVDGCGIEVNPQSPGSLASAIVKLAENRNLYQSLSDNCNVVLSKYDSHKTLTTIYSKLRLIANERY